LHAELVIVAVQIVDVLRDNLSLKVLPGTVPDAIARVYGRLALGGLGTQIGAPSLVSCACALRQFLTMPISAFDAPEIGAFARPGSDHEERHIRGLGWRLLCPCLETD
jgi:hypothetical protein